MHLAGIIESANRFSQSLYAVVQNLAARRTPVT